MQGALRARLLAAVPVTTLLPTYTPQGGAPTKPVFWVDRPQTSPLPAIVLQTISDPRPQHLKGFHDLRETRVQMDVLGTSYSSVRAISEAAIAALVTENTSNGIIFNRATVDGSRDLGERTETQFIHRNSVDLLIWWQAA